MFIVLTCFRVICTVQNCNLVLILLLNYAVNKQQGGWGTMLFTLHLTRIYLDKNEDRPLKCAVNSPYDPI